MNSRLQQTIFLVVLVTLLAIGNASNAFSPDSDIGLLSYMARSNELLQQDPSRSLECFNKYIPLINQIAKDYETNFQACLNESAAASTKADEATLEQRNELANAAETSCALLQQCPQDSTVEGIFQCYIDGGSTNVRTMYTINANASQELAALREQYYLIRNDEYKCTNATKRAYEKESTEAYAGLNNCILGNSDAVTTEQPTTAPQTTTTAPTEVTTTSAETEPTDGPVTSTTSPETTNNVPEETTTENPAESSTTEEPTTTSTTETTSAEPTATSEAAPETTESAPEESTSARPEEQTL